MSVMPSEGPAPDAVGSALDALVYSDRGGKSLFLTSIALSLQSKSGQTGWTQWIDCDLCSTSTSALRTRVSVSIWEKLLSTAFSVSSQQLAQSISHRTTP